MTEWLVKQFDSVGDDLEARLALSRKVFFWTHVPLTLLQIVIFPFSTLASLAGTLTLVLSAWICYRTYTRCARAAREALVRDVMTS